MELIDLVGVGIKMVICLAICYTVLFDGSANEKHLDLAKEDYRKINDTVTHTHTDKGELTDLGYTLLPRLIFDKSKIYPVILGMNTFQQLKLKEFDHFAFTYENYIVQMAYSNMKYSGSIFFFLYDYEEKRVIYEKKIDLLPFLDSFNLPQLNDSAHLCESSVQYSRKGMSIDVVSKVEGKKCVTTIKWEQENEMSFEGVHVKNFAEDESYTSIRALDKEKKFFFFNQKEYLRNCSFMLQINRDFLEKGVSDWGQADFSDKKCARVKTPTKDVVEDCYGHLDYGRGVFLYKTNWFWTFAQGRAKYVEAADDFKVALNFGGALAHPDNVSSNEDYIKIGNKITMLHPVKMVYDKLNHMNGFVFKTDEKFADKKTGLTDLVFTSNKEKNTTTNFLVLKGKLHYTFGTFSGHIIDDDGNKIVIKDLKAEIEVANFKW